MYLKKLIVLIFASIFLFAEDSPAAAMDTSSPINTSFLSFIHWDCFENSHYWPRKNQSGPPTQILNWMSQFQGEILEKGIFVFDPISSPSRWDDQTPNLSDTMLIEYGLKTYDLNFYLRGQFLCEDDTHVKLELGAYYSKNPVPFQSYSRKFKKNGYILNTIEGLDTDFLLPLAQKLKDKFYLNKTYNLIFAPALKPQTRSEFFKVSNEFLKNKISLKLKNLERQKDTYIVYSQLNLEELTIFFKKQSWLKSKKWQLAPDSSPNP